MSAKCSIVPVDDLLFAVCVVDRLEKRDRSAPSDFHHRILKCRMIIFSLEEIIAAPNPKERYEIFVVYQKDPYVEKKILKRLEELKLTICRFETGNLSIYESCFEYTLIAKLAPHWNRIGSDILVKGKNFLSVRSSEAISYNIRIRDDTIIIDMKSKKIHLTSLDVRDLNVVSESMERFRNVPNAILSTYMIENRQVHVLPSFKKGCVVNVYKGIPETSIFRNYKDLRRHWKNMYGYRLSEDEGEILFYEIYFAPFGEQSYIYPSICLRSNFPLLTTPPKDTVKNIEENFLFDVNRYMRPFGNNLHFNLFHNNIDNINVPLLLKLEPCIKSPEKDLIEDGENETENISLCTATQNNTMKKIVPIFLPRNTSLLANALKEPQTNKNELKNRNNQILTTNVKENTHNIPETIPLDHKLISKNESVNFSSLNVSKTINSFNNLSSIQTKRSIPEIKKSQKMTKKTNGSFVDILETAKTRPKILEEMTVPALYEWLRSQHVHVTTRYKKCQLIEKALEFVNSKK